MCITLCALYETFGNFISNVKKYDRYTRVCMFYSRNIQCVEHKFVEPRRQIPWTFDDVRFSKL